MNLHKKKRSASVKAKAIELGFSACGISRACFLEEEAPRLEDWLKKRYNGEMYYMANHFDKRLDPTLLVPGAKSVISVLQNYFPAQSQTDPNAPIVSKYAYGEDYHDVVKKKLRILHQFINDEFGQIEGRSFADSAPVLEKAWAVKSGLGWIGKNSNLLTKTGSFFFLGELIIDLELEYDEPIKNLCGSCTKCIDACPTQAIIETGVIDARKCISYLTIENKGEIPLILSDKFQNRVFGCDICQDVCPWNSKVNAHKESDFMPNPDFLNMKKKDWENLTEERFRLLFRKSAIKRSKYQGLMRNIKALKS